MTTNEAITICISIAALIVSLTTLYFTVFYKKIAAIGRLIAWNPQNHEQAEEKIESHGVVEFALSNTGNRELLVSYIEIDWERPPKVSITPIVSSNEIPCVLKPSQMLLVRFEILYSFLHDISEFNQKLLVRFHVISQEGDFYFLEKLLEPFLNDGEGSDNEDDFKPFVLKKVKFSKVKS